MISYSVLAMIALNAPPPPLILEDYGAWQQMIRTGLEQGQLGIVHCTVTRDANLVLFVMSPTILYSGNPFTVNEFLKEDLLQCSVGSYSSRASLCDRGSGSTSILFSSFDLQH